MAHLVRVYEEKLEKGAPFYMDACEFADIVEYYMSNRRDFDAETCLRHALRIHPEDEDLLLQRAYMLKNAGRWEEARTLAESHLDKSQRNYKSFAYEYCLAHADYEKGDRLLREWLKAEADDFERQDFCEEMAEISFDYGLYEISIELLSMIPADYDRYKQSRVLLAASYFQILECEKAVGILNGLLDADPYDDTLWEEMADGLYRNKRYKDAIESADYALAIQPGNASAAQIKLNCLYFLQRYDEMAASGMEYIKKNPTDLSVFIILADALCRSARYPEALPVINQAYAMCPADSMDRPRILLCMFTCLIEMGAYPEVKSLVRATSSYTYYLFRVYAQAIHLLFEKGRRAEAVEVLALAMQEDDISTEDLRALLFILYNAHCFREAKDTWKRLKTIFLFSEEIAYVAYAYREMGLRYAFLLEQAILLSEGATKFLFDAVFPGRPFSEYLEAAKEEDKALSDEAEAE